jgi:hypothetical protein
MWHIIWMTAGWVQDQANTQLALPVTTLPYRLLSCTDFSNSPLASKQMQNKLCSQFTVKLLKEQKQGLKAWTVHIIIFVAFNWSCLYISIVHHLLVGTITHPSITNLFAHAICICCHCDNTMKLTLADQFPRVKNIFETE